MARLLRRFARVVLAIAGYLVVLVLGLVALVLVALAIPPLRDLAVREGVSYANQSLDGMHLSVKSVDRIDPLGVNVRGIQIDDEKGRTMLKVRWVLVRLNPLPLVNGTLALTRVRVDDVEAQLYASDEKKKEEPPEEDSGPSTFTIRADDVRVRGVALTMPWSGRTLRAVVGTLAASGQWGPKPALALTEATVRAHVDRDLLLRLHTTEGAWRAERGGRVGLVALVAGAPLTLDAELPALDQMEPWPLRKVALRIRNVQRETLALLGVVDGAQLAVPVDLALDAHTEGRRLEATARVRAGRAALDLNAGADDEAYDLRVAIAPVVLSSIAGILPNLKVTGDLRAHATPGAGVPKRADLAWKRVALDDGRLPDGKLRVALPLPVVRLERLTLVGFEDALSLDGEYNTETSAMQFALALSQLHLEAIEWLKKQGMAGMLDGNLSAGIHGGKLEGGGKLAVRGFKHPSASLGSLDLDFGLGGTTTAPEGHLALSVLQIAAGDVKLDEVSLGGNANTHQVAGKLLVRGPSTLLRGELGGERTRYDDLRLQAIGRGTLLKHDVRFDLRELLYGKHGVTLQQLALYSGKQALRVSGSLDDDDHVQAELGLDRIDLGEWARLAGVKETDGRLSGTARVDGTLAKPRVDAHIELKDVRYRAKLPISGTLDLAGDLDARTADAKIALSSTSELGARATLSLRMPKRPADLDKAAKLAHLHADVNAYMPLEQISAMGGDQLAGLGGMLEAKIKADGTLEAPKLEADVLAALKLPEQEGEPTEGIRITANITKDEGKVGIWAKDEAGELLIANGEVDWPGGNPRAALEHPEAFQNARFRVQAELQPRRFDTMQGAFAYFSKLYALSLPLRAGGKVTLDGNQGRLDGAAKLQLVLYGDKLDGRCRLGAQSSLDLDARLKQDRVEVELSALTDGGGKLQGKVDTKLTLDAKPDQPVLGPAKVKLDGKDIAIHKLPGLCNLAGGKASFSVDASGLGNERPVLALDARIDDLRAANSEPLSVVAHANAGGSAAKISADLASKGRAIGVISAGVPLSYPDGTTPTVLPNAPVDARVQLTKLPLADVLAFTEALGRVRGTASADLRVTGKLDDPVPNGTLQLEDVDLSVAAIAQPFRDVNGRIEIKGRSINIPELVARDRDGKLTLQGFASLRQDLTGKGGVYLEADKFPLRQQGTIIGELTTRARMDVQIPSDLKAQAQLKILDGAIWLTGERGKSVQTLDPHPDVRFADEKVEQESTPAEDKAEGDVGLTIGNFTMKTERELWLNHEDFSIQVGIDIALKEGEAGPKLEGEATLKRGSLKLLGKEFRLEKGALRFTGDMPPDPELDIKATFQPPTGRALIVQVTGRGSAPVLEFSGAATNAGEAVSVLTGVGGGSASQQGKTGAENDATAKMASMAANMTAGLLIMTARREFGEWVPMISIETGASGQPTTARAGFDASKLIPPWLEGFARGAYVEGIIGQNANAGGRTGVGVRLEIAMPRDFITTLGYGPGPGWSSDVAWSP